MKNVVVCVPMDKQTQDAIISRLGRIEWLKDAKVTLVNVFKEENYPYMVPPTIYPTQEQKGEIAKTVTDIFDNLMMDVNAKEKRSECIFHPNPKEGMIDYIKANKPDIAISYTKEKHGFKDYFHSSFTEYLIKHAPCDILTIR